MKQRKSERISRLEGASSSNNAFILRIGEYFFVEFGETGNACYIYLAENLPFDTRSSQLSLHELKNKYRAIAHPSHGGSWEAKFQQHLRELGIFPDREERAAPRATPSLRGVASLATDHGPPPQDWLTQAEGIAATYNVELLDQRSQGGCVWLVMESPKHPAAEKLMELGFRFAEGRGFWRKK